MALLFLPETAYAQETFGKGGEAQSAQEEMERQIGRVIDGLDLKKTEEIVIDASWLGADGGEMGVRQALQAFASGETISVEALLESILRVFSSAAVRSGAAMAGIMAPVLLTSVFAQMLVGKREMTGGLSGVVCFTLTLIPLLLLVVRELEHTKDTITAMTARMEDVLPVLLTLLTALGGNASSAFLHPMVIMASGSMVFLVREVILRLVMCTCAVTAVNHLSERAHLTRMAQLLRSAVCWLLGISFTVFIGSMTLQGVCSASIDGIMIRAAKYAVDNFVPVVGGMFSDTMDTLVGCTLIVKNALGLTCVLVLCGGMIAPMLRTLASVFTLKLSAALLEPVAGTEIIAAITDFTRIMVLFLITMLCVGTMYFLLIVQMLLVGNLTVMLR